MGGSGSGGGTQTVVQENNYDPEASRRMAEVAERQVSLQEQMMSYYEDVFQPYETEAVDIARANLEGRGALDREQIAAQRNLLGDRTELEQRAIREQIRDIEANRELRDAAREEQMREIERTSLVADRFYDTALRGVDVEGRLQTATADVSQGFTQAQQQTARMAGRYGVSPRAADFTTSGLEQAKAIAGARTATRRDADRENFSMLQSAMAARGVGVAGVPSVTGQGTVPFTGSGGSPADRMAITSPVAAAQGFGQAATQGFGALATRTMSSTSTGPSGAAGGGGPGIMGGAMAGASMGTAIMPGWGTAIGAVGGGLMGALSG